MAEPSNRWTPKQVHKTITLIAGILLMATGVILLCNGVGAQGSIDIKTAFLTGKITSGSAGLFCFFFGLILIIIGNIFSKPGEGSNNRLWSEKRIISLLISSVMIILLLLIIVCFPQVQMIALMIMGIILLPFGKSLIELK